MSELQVLHPDFSKRLNEMMDKAGFDINDLSNRTGINYEMIRRYAHGYAKPRDANLRKIADALKASITYLSYGELPKEKVSVDDLKAKIAQIKEKKSPPTIAGQSVAKLVDSGMMPVISWVAAGSWTDVDPVTLDDVLEEVPRFPDMSPRAFGLRIKGRSMSPYYNPDDIIYVEPEITPWDLTDGDLVVVQCNDGKEATFKQLVIGETADDMYLKPLNPDWPEQRLQPMGECVLIGVVMHQLITRRRIR